MAKILVVEDDFYIAEMLKSILTDAGYQCETAGNTTDAFNLLLENDYQALVSDIGLPERYGSMADEENGFLFIKAAHGNPRSKDIPIIAATGFDCERIWDEVKNDGVLKVMAKPKLSEKLVSTLIELGVAPEQKRG